ncbi:hypothetical protein [Bifidobacterium choladohabitans]
MHCAICQATPPLHLSRMLPVVANMGVGMLNRLN